MPRANPGEIWIVDLFLKNGVFHLQQVQPLPLCGHRACALLHSRPWRR